MVSGIRGLFICCVLATQWILIERVLSPAEGLATYSTLLISYVTLEIWHQKRRLQPVLVMPPVITSITVFIVQFGLSNVLFWLPEETLATVGSSSTVTPWMNKLMVLVSFAACSMWVGYASSIGQSIGKRFQDNSVLRRLIAGSGRVNRPALCVCIGLSIASRLLMFRLNVWGYLANYEQLTAVAHYREYLSLLNSLGTWALIAVALERFGLLRPSLSDRLLLWFMLGNEVVWGFLSGFKSIALMPIFLVGLAHYSQHGRLQRWFIPASVGVLLAAYAVIEPYRVLSIQGAVRSDLRGISSTMIGIATGDSAPDLGVPTSLRLLSRANLTYAASIGVEYAAGGDLPPGSPDFLGNILWSPARAIVPRLLWDTKPRQEDGLWYTRQVMGRDWDSITSTGMSAITYLNFAGGLVAVVCGFLLVGITQRALFDGLGVFGAGGWFVILGMLPTLTNFESSFDFFTIGTIRLLPLLVILQHLLVRGRVRSGVPLRLRVRPSEATVAHR